MDAQTRLAVIVLGMHRSGTSALAGATLRLGLAPPSTPLPPTFDNPTGFHEPLAVGAFNDLVMKAIGCDWHDCLTFEPSMLDDEACAAATPRCEAILREEYGEAPTFVLKEPRLSLCLPLWLPALRAMGAAVSVLLVARHPEEVTKSLFWRDMLPEADTVRVWLHYMLEAERVSRALPRAVVLYEDLLHDWHECLIRAGRAARIAWPRAGFPDDGPPVLATLRHHVAANDAISVASPTLRPLVAETWSALRTLARDPASSAARTTLDQVHASFARDRFSRSRSDPSERQSFTMGQDSSRAQSAKLA